MKVSPVVTAVATVRAAQVVTSLATRQIGIPSGATGGVVAAFEIKGNMDLNESAENYVNDLKRQASEEEKDGCYRKKDYHRALAKETELENIERVPGGRITQGVYDYVADHFPDKNREAALSNRKSDLEFLREQAAFESTQRSRNEFFTKEIERDRIEGGRFQREYVEDAVKDQERVHEASTTLNKMA